MISDIKRKIQQQLEKEEKESAKERNITGITFFNRIISSKPEKLTREILNTFADKNDKIKKVKNIKTSNNRNKITALLSKIRNTIKSKKGKKMG